MKYKVYFGNTGGMCGHVLDLPGCVSPGKTLPEAIDNVKDAIAGYLEVVESRR